MEEKKKINSTRNNTFRVIMRLLAILVCVNVVGCGNGSQSIQNQFEEFRLKYAENNGDVWNYKKIDGDDIFTLVSQNNYNVDNKTACFAKVVVCPTEREMFMAVSNVNLQNTGNINITANHKTLELSAFESERIKEHFLCRFYSSVDTTNEMHKLFNNADSLTFFYCNRKPDMSRLIYFTIDIFHGRDTITFEFDSKKSIMDLMMEMKSNNK